MSFGCEQWWDEGRKEARYKECPCRPDDIFKEAIPRVNSSTVAQSEEVMAYEQPVYQILHLLPHEVKPMSWIVSESIDNQKCPLNFKKDQCSSPELDMRPGLPVNSRRSSRRQPKGLPLGSPTSALLSGPPMLQCKSALLPSKNVQLFLKWLVSSNFRVKLDRLD